MRHYHSMSASVRRGLLSLAVAGLLLLTGACGSTAASPSQPKVAAAYISQIKQWEKQGSVSNPAAKQAFADYYVSAEENSQVNQLFTACMAKHGYKVSGWTAGGGYTVSAPRDSPLNNSDVESKAEIACSSGGLDLVSFIYEQEQSNPKGESPVELIRGCYRKHHVPDGENLSDSEFMKMVDPSNFAEYMPSSPAAALCLVDTTGEGGMSAAQAWNLMKEYHANALKEAGLSSK